MFEYAMFNRPLSIGTAPPGWTGTAERPAEGQPFHATARHGILIYDKPLTADDTARFELAPMVRAGTEDEDFQIAVAVDGLLYRKEDIQGALRELDAQAFASAIEAAVFGAVDRHWGGFPLAFEYPGGFVAKVFNKLSEVWRDAPSL